jgi:hypothetical protein
MRVCLTLTVFLFGLTAPLAAQPGKEKPAARPTSRAILANLQLEVPSADFTNPMAFGELLDLSRGKLEGAGKEIAFAIDEEAFKEENAEAPSAFEFKVRLTIQPAKTTLMQVLRLAVKQLPIKSALVVRAGRVDIVPLARTSKEFMLNQTFHVDFSERKLDAALEELSELTGVSIVMDQRAKQKAQTTVTARFHDDVALQDAVRMLTDMAELKIVYLVTGLYVTTPEHAKVMQKELKDLYEPKILGGPLPMIGGPPDPSLDPLLSPLAPPLPPSKKRLDPAA